MQNCRFAQSSFHHLRLLVIIFLVLVLVKSVLSLAIPAPSIWSDEYVYSKLAQGIFTEHKFLIHGKPINTYPPLYPIVLSPAYLFSDMFDVYQTMKIINSIISSLIIFPIFFLAREILSKKRALLCAALISIIPANFSFAPYLMAENLFYPLFITTIFFIYKTYFDYSLKYAALAGIFTGLTILTKLLGVPLLLLPFAMAIFNIFKKTNITVEAKRLLVFYFAAFLTILPWILQKRAYFGYTLSGMFGSYSTVPTSVIRHGAKIFIPSFLNWIILYFGFIVLASGIVFAIFALLSYKLSDKKTKLFFILSTITMIIFVILLANNSAGGPAEYASPFQWFTERPIGRYLDPVLPLVFILGFKGLSIKKHELDNKLVTKLCLLVSLLLVFSTQLTIASLFPVNNMSISYLGILKYGLEFVLFGKTSTVQIFNWITFLIMLAFLAIIPILFLALHKLGKITFRRIFLFFVVFFLLSSLGNYAITQYAANKLYKNEQMQLGLWLKDFDSGKSLVLFDARDAGKLVKTNATVQIARDGHFATIAGFWLKNKIEIWNGEDTNTSAYLISKQTLDTQPIKKFGDLYIYMR